MLAASVPELIGSYKPGAYFAQPCSTSVNVALLTTENVSHAVLSNDPKALAYACGPINTGQASLCLKAYAERGQADTALDFVLTTSKHGRLLINEETLVSLILAFTRAGKSSELEAFHDSLPADLRTPAVVRAVLFGLASSGLVDVLERWHIIDNDVALNNTADSTAKPTVSLVPVPYEWIVCAYGVRKDLPGAIAATKRALIAALPAQASALKSNKISTKISTLTEQYSSNPQNPLTPAAISAVKSVEQLILAAGNCGASSFARALFEWCVAGDAKHASAVASLPPDVASAINKLARTAKHAVETEELQPQTEEVQPKPNTPLFNIGSLSVLMSGAPVTSLSSTLGRGPVDMDSSIFQVAASFKYAFPGVLASSPAMYMNIIGAHASEGALTLAKHSLALLLARSDVEAAVPRAEVATSLLTNNKKPMNITAIGGAMGATSNSVGLCYNWPSSSPTLVNEWLLESIHRSLVRQRSFAESSTWAQDDFVQSLLSYAKSIVDEMGGVYLPRIQKLSSTSEKSTSEFYNQSTTQITPKALGHYCSCLLLVGSTSQVLSILESCFENPADKHPEMLELILEAALIPVLHSLERQIPDDNFGGIGNASVIKKLLRIILSQQDTSEFAPTASACGPMNLNDSFESTISQASEQAPSPNAESPLLHFLTPTSHMLIHAATLYLALHEEERAVSLLRAMDRLGLETKPGHITLLLRTALMTRQPKVAATIADILPRIDTSGNGTKGEDGVWVALTFALSGKSQGALTLIEQLIDDSSGKPFGDILASALLSVYYVYEHDKLEHPPAPVEESKKEAPISMNTFRNTYRPGTLGNVTKSSTVNGSLHTLMDKNQDASHDFQDPVEGSLSPLEHVFLLFISSPHVSALLNKAGGIGDALTALETKEASAQLYTSHSSDSQLYFSGLQNIPQAASIVPAFLPIVDEIENTPLGESKNVSSYAREIKHMARAIARMTTRVISLFSLAIQHTFDTTKDVYNCVTLFNEYTAFMRAYKDAYRISRRVVSEDVSVLASIGSTEKLSNTTSRIHSTAKFLEASNVFSSPYVALSHILFLHLVQRTGAQETKNILSSVDGSYTSSPLSSQPKESVKVSPSIPHGEITLYLEPISASDPSESVSLALPVHVTRGSSLLILQSVLSVCVADGVFPSNSILKDALMILHPAIAPIPIPNLGVEQAPWASDVEEAVSMYHQALRAILQTSPLTPIIPPTFSTEVLRSLSSLACLEPTVVSIRLAALAATGRGFEFMLLWRDYLRERGNELVLEGVSPRDTNPGLPLCAAVIASFLNGLNALLAVLQIPGETYHCTPEAIANMEAGKVLPGPGLISPTLALQEAATALILYIQEFSASEDINALIPTERSIPLSILGPFARLLLSTGHMHAAKLLLKSVHSCLFPSLTYPPEDWKDSVSALEALYVQVETSQAQEIADVPSLRTIPALSKVLLELNKYILMPNCDYIKARKAVDVDGFASVVIALGKARMLDEMFNFVASLRVPLSDHDEVTAGAFQDLVSYSSPMTLNSRDIRPARTDVAREDYGAGVFTHLLNSTTVLACYTAYCFAGDLFGAEKILTDARYALKEPHFGASPLGSAFSPSRAPLSPGRFALSPYARTPFHGPSSPLFGIKEEPEESAPEDEDPEDTSVRKYCLEYSLRAALSAAGLFGSLVFAVQPPPVRKVEPLPVHFSYAVHVLRITSLAAEGKPHEALRRLEAALLEGILPPGPTMTALLSSFTRAVAGESLTGERYADAEISMPSPETLEDPTANVFENYANQLEDKIHPLNYLTPGARAMISVPPPDCPAHSTHAPYVAAKELIGEKVEKPVPYTNSGDMVGTFKKTLQKQDALVSTLFPSDKPLPDLFSDLGLSPSASALRRLEICAKALTDPQSAWKFSPVSSLPTAWTPSSVDATLLVHMYAYAGRKTTARALAWAFLYRHLSETSRHVATIETQGASGAAQAHGVRSSHVRSSVLVRLAKDVEQMLDLCIGVGRPGSNVATEPVETTKEWAKRAGPAGAADASRSEEEAGEENGSAIWATLCAWGFSDLVNSPSADSMYMTHSVGPNALLTAGDSLKQSTKLVLNQPPLLELTNFTRTIQRDLVSTAVGDHPVPGETTAPQTIPNPELLVHVSLIECMVSLLANACPVDYLQGKVTETQVQLLIRVTASLGMTVSNTCTDNLAEAVNRCRLAGAGATSVLRNPLGAPLQASTIPVHVLNMLQKKAIHTGRYSDKLKNPQPVFYSFSDISPTAVETPEKKTTSSNEQTPVNKDVHFLATSPVAFLRMTPQHVFLERVLSHLPVMIANPPSVFSHTLFATQKTCLPLPADVSFSNNDSKSASELAKLACSILLGPSLHSNISSTVQHQALCALSHSLCPVTLPYIVSGIAGTPFDFLVNLVTRLFTNSTFVPRDASPYVAFSDVDEHGIKKDGPDFVTTSNCNFLTTLDIISVFNARPNPPAAHDPKTCAHAWNRDIALFRDLAVPADQKASVSVSSALSPQPIARAKSSQALMKSPDFIATAADRSDDDITPSELYESLNQTGIPNLILSQDEAALVHSDAALRHLESHVIALGLELRELEENTAKCQDELRHYQQLGYWQGAASLATGGVLSLPGVEHEEDIKLLGNSMREMSNTLPFYMNATNDFILPVAAGGIGDSANVSMSSSLIQPFVSFSTPSLSLKAKNRVKDLQQALVVLEKEAEVILDQMILEDEAKERTPTSLPVFQHIADPEASEAIVPVAETTPSQLWMSYTDALIAIQAEEEEWSKYLGSLLDEISAVEAKQSQISTLFNTAKATAEAGLDAERGTPSAYASETAAQEALALAPHALGPTALAVMNAQTVRLTVSMASELWNPEADQVYVSSEAEVGLALASTVEARNRIEKKRAGLVILQQAVDALTDGSDSISASVFSTGVETPWVETTKSIHDRLMEVRSEGKNLETQEPWKTGYRLLTEAKLGVEAAIARHELETKAWEADYIARCVEEERLNGETLLAETTKNYLEEAQEIAAVAAEKCSAACRRLKETMNNEADALIVEAERIAAANAENIRVLKGDSEELTQILEEEKAVVGSLVGLKADLEAVANAGGTMGLLLKVPEPATTAGNTKAQNSVIKFNRSITQPLDNSQSLTRSLRFSQLKDSFSALGVSGRGTFSRSKRATSPMRLYSVKASNEIVLTESQAMHNSLAARAKHLRFLHIGHLTPANALAAGLEPPFNSTTSLLAQALIPYNKDEVEGVDRESLDELMKNLQEDIMDTLTDVAASCPTPAAASQVYMNLAFDFAYSCPLPEENYQSILEFHAEQSKKSMGDAMRIQSNKPLAMDYRVHLPALPDDENAQAKAKKATKGSSTLLPPGGEEDDYGAASEEIRRLQALSRTVVPEGVFISARPT